MQNSKVKEVTLVSAVNVVDNSVDEAREFDIKANVESAVSNVRSFSAGEVREKDSKTIVATFTIYEMGSENIQPQPNIDNARKLAAISAIYGFTEDVKRMYADPNAE